MLLTFLSNQMKQQLQYRSNFLFSILGSFIYIYIRICVWKALLPYDHSGMATLSEMVTYTLMVEFCRHLTRFNTSSILRDQVRTGNIAISLVRPVSLCYYNFQIELTNNIMYFLFSGIPVFIAAAFIWGIAVPQIWQFLLFVISTILGGAIMFFFDYAIGLCSFWLKNGISMGMLVDGLFSIFSGSSIPLWFYPNWLADICRFLPFRLVSFEPISIYLGRYNGVQAVQILLLQIVWLVLCIGLKEFIWKKVQKAVVSQGG